MSMISIDATGTAYINFYLIEKPLNRYIDHFAFKNFYFS